MKSKYATAKDAFLQQPTISAPPVGQFTSPCQEELDALYAKQQFKGRPPKDSLGKMGKLMRAGHFQWLAVPISELTQPLVGKGDFAMIRRSYGLAHRTIPDALVLDVLTLDEGPDPECEARNKPAVTYADLYVRTNSALVNVTKKIKQATRKGGTKLRQRTNIHSLVVNRVQHIIDQLAAKQMRYKIAIRELEKLGINPVPCERTLRRMIKKKSDIKSH